MSENDDPSWVVPPPETLSEADEHQPCEYVGGISMAGEKFMSTKCGKCHHAWPCLPAALRAEVLRLRRQVAKEHAKYLEADVYRQTEAAALRDAEAEVLRLREALTALVVSAASFDGIRLSNAIAAARALLVEGSGVPADNRAKNLGFQKGWPQ